MSKTTNYEISDSLWGRATQYASSVWESWGKDVDEYVEDVMETDSRSDDELYGSTVLQDSAHSVELVAHLVGSVFSNDYTKERVKELGTVIADTDTYKSTSETLNELETTLTQASEQFMQEHPKVQTAFMATQEKLEEAKAYVTQEAKEFATNHPEITNDLKAIVEIAAITPAAKVSKIALEAKELSALEKLDYTHTQGKELAKGIPSEIDKTSIHLEELAVTAEAKVGKETLFDSNQKARVVAHPETSTLRHDEIRAEEAKKIAKVERDIEKAEIRGEPWTEEQKQNAFHKASKPNATLAQSHAETAVIQKAYEKGLTQDADMFIKVNGKEVCGHCNSDTIAMAKESGLKSITIHDYNAVNKKNPEKPIIHWNEETGRKRYDSFEELENTVKDLPKVPDHIKHTDVIEAERTRMNAMDVALVGAGGMVLMHEGVSEENTLDQEVLEQRVDKQTYQTLDQTEVQDRQMHEPQKEEKFDNTSKAKEIANRYTQSLGITLVDREQTYLTEATEATNSNVTFDDNSYDVDAQSYNAPTDYISMEISNRLPQQQIEENTLSQEELTDQAAQRIYDDIAQKYGSSNDYDNDYDVGMEIE
jgi:hypothetical protein